MSSASAANKINSVNGQDKQSSPMQVVKTDAEKPQAKAQAQAEVKSTQPELTLEQKIQKVQDLSLLIDKLNMLSETKRNLQTFKLSSDGLGIQLFLRDSINGREFKTQNSVVIARLIEEINSTLQEKIDEVQQQIRF
jgi:hypothetical protein